VNVERDPGSIQSRGLHVQQQKTLILVCFGMLCLFLPTTTKSISFGVLVYALVSFAYFNHHLFNLLLNKRLKIQHNKTFAAATANNLI
jgi:hypothetical protein